MGLSSQQVLTFIPLDTWTPVILIPGSKRNDNETYLISTNEKYLKRCKDMYSMALQSYKFEKVETYRSMSLVAVEIKGLWCRGRMLSYNEFLVKNTIVELIDCGSIVKKRLCDLYQLPDSYRYDPLCLSIKPVNNIPLSMSGQFYVQPLLLISELHLGYVVVDTKPIDVINEVNSKVNFKEMDLERMVSSAINTKSTCTIKEPEYSWQNNLVIQKKNANNLLNCVKEQGFKDNVINNLKEIFDTEKNNGIETSFDNIIPYCPNIVSKTPISEAPKNLSFNCVDLINPVVAINDVECNKHKDKNNVDAPVIKDPCIEDSKTSAQCLFKSGSLVEFCNGTNTDFVYIKSYEEKQKYSNEMKQFYIYYKNKNNLKVKTNVNNGDMVAASLIYNKAIHRAIILDKSAANSFGLSHLCFFVDIGCKKYVNSGFIYDLFEEAKTVPYLAHKVRLQNMPFYNTMQLKYVKNYFDKLYLQPLIIEFNEDDPNGLNSVVLKNKRNNMNIYSEIKEYIQKSLDDMLSNEGVESKINEYLNCNDVFKNGTRVLITHFNSVNEIYVRINTSELIKHRDQIVSEVNEFFNHTKSSYHRMTPKIGSHIAVKSLSKNKILRAIVSKKIDEVTYLVHYTDYGHMEHVKTFDIFILPHKFRVFPKTVIKIGLDGDFLISEVKTISNYFNQLIQLSVPLIAEFDDGDPLGLQKVTLKKETSGINIFKDIFDQNHE